MQATDPTTEHETEQGARQFREWALVELMGHRREAGLVTEATFPAGWIRLDIPVGTDPDAGWAATRFYNPSAGYGITPCTEALVREYATAHPPAPVTIWDLPEAIRERLRPRAVSGELDDGSDDGTDQVAVLRPVDEPF